MPITALDIANQALGVIDEAPIASFAEDSKPARLMNTHYELTVEAELSKYVWAFAMTTDEIEGTNINGSEGTLTYEYEIPSDCLRILPLTHNGEPDGIPLSWEQRNGKIYSDYAGPITLRYIGRLTEPDDWNALFTEVLISALAVKVALPLTHKQGMVEVARQAYSEAVRAALKANAIERQGQNYRGAWSTWRGDTRYWRA